MPVKFTLTFEVQDNEFKGFLDRWTPGISDRPLTVHSAPSDGPTRLADEDDDNAPVNSAAPSVDKNGIPWMEQFHSGSKAINADGTWKSRKGVDKTARAAAEAAYKAQSAAPAPVLVATAPVAPVAAMPTLVNPMEQLRDTVTAAPTPFALPAAGLPTFAAPVAPPQDVPVSYNDIMNKFNALVGAGVVLDINTIQPIYAAAGVTDPTALTDNETLRVALMRELNKINVPVAA